MLNRPNSLTNESLEARRGVGAELRELLREIPPTPFDWKCVDPAVILRSTGAAPDLRLTALARLLCTAPARGTELKSLWVESVLTGAFALRIAPLLGGDAQTAGIAGLLHRVGDILTIRAIAEIEHAAGLRLDSASKADLCAEHGGEQLERVVRAWSVPPPRPPNGIACANSPGPRPMPRRSTWRGCWPSSAFLRSFAPQAWWTAQRRRPDFRPGPCRMLGPMPR